MSLTFAPPSNTNTYGKLLKTGRPREPSSQLYLRRFVMAFEVPPLPYDYNALEPYIDTQTMQLHHDKHHQTYVTNLNNALQSAQAIPGPHAEPTIPGPHAEPTIPGPHAMQFASMSVDDVVRHIHDVPDSIRTAVRNNAGGHSNHSMFWQIMKPNGGGEPTGALASAIQQAFGSFDQFKAAFNDAGAKRFGSGWAWLVLDSNGRLAITSTANQDSPLMDGQFPVMGNDVW